jgi:F0F1-type ATP synthase membrane subunit a
MIGLCIFIFIQILNVIALLADLYRILHGEESITMACRDYLPFGLSIMAIQMVAMISLAYHFWGKYLTP